MVIRFSSDSWLLNIFFKVWAYGVTIFEIMTCGLQPYTKMSNSEVIDYVMNGGKLDLPEDQYLRQDIDKLFDNELWKIKEMCMDSDDKKRPSFQEVFQMVSTLCFLFI